MPNQAATVVKFIQDIKTAIRTVNAQGDALTSITGATLELNAKLEDTGDGTVTWEVIEIGANLKNTLVQTIRLELIPQTPGDMGLEARPEVSQVLVNAIEAIKIGVKEALQSEPPYKLKTGTVTLNVGVEAGGAIKLFGLGVGISEAHTQAITLTVGPNKP